jgi:hypothetical protein
MVLWPGLYGSTLPGIYGPIKYPVKKTEDGYYIRGYSSTEFIGSFRDIAKQIVMDMTLKPETGARQGTKEYAYVGPFVIYFKPELRCHFVMDADPEPEDLDLQEVSKGITEELKSLVKLIPFS